MLVTPTLIALLECLLHRSIGEHDYHFEILGHTCRRPQSYSIVFLTEGTKLANLKAPSSFIISESVVSGAAPAS
jgi:hypothetical protein